MIDVASGPADVLQHSKLAHAGSNSCPGLDAVFRFDNGSNRGALPSA